jgi:hypothetical protein
MRTYTNSIVSLLLRLACYSATSVVFVAVQIEILRMFQSMIDDLFQSLIVDIGQIAIPKKTQRVVEQDPKGDRNHSKITDTNRNMTNLQHENT